MSSKSAVALLSGGLDSTVATAYAQHLGYGVAAITFQYGQKHASKECLAAAKIAGQLGISHREVYVDLGYLHQNSLTGNAIVPPASGDDPQAPSTYVPILKSGVRLIRRGETQKMGLERNETEERRRAVAAPRGCVDLEILPWST